MILATVFLIGLCFGSFVTLASYRLPRGEEVVRARSRCPHCRHTLGARDLVPLFSWVLAKGRCRYCQQRASGRYPLIELTCGLTFVLLYQRYGLSAPFGALALFATALLTLIVADLETGLIPDPLHYFLAPLGLFYHWALLGTPWAPPLTAAAIALAAGAALHYGYRQVRGRDGLGLGDVKFLGVAGIWLASPYALVVFFVISGLLGILTGMLWRIVRRQARFPFGPALAVALFLLVIFPQAEWKFWQLLASSLYPYAP